MRKEYAVSFEVFHKQRKHLNIHVLHSLLYNVFPEVHFTRFNLTIYRGQVDFRKTFQDQVDTEWLSVVARRLINVLGNYKVVVTATAVGNPKDNVLLFFDNLCD